MALVWVTGISGTGKSSVCEILKGEGHPAFDADWDGFSHWVHRITSEAVVDPPYPVPPGWIDEYAWRIRPERVKSVKLAVDPGVGVLFGAVENEAAVWQCFDRVVCLVIDDNTLRHRLSTRTTNEFGKHPEELREVLAWNRTFEARYRQVGATIIDATQPVEVVADKVLAVAGL